MPFRDLIDYSKFTTGFVNESTDFNQISFTQLLQQNFDEDIALDQLKYMFSVRHVFQYSLNPDHTLLTYTHRDVISPADDAFTSTIKAILRNLCKKRLLGNHRCNLLSSHQTVF